MVVLNTSKRLKDSFYSSECFHINYMNIFPHLLCFSIKYLQDQQTGLWFHGKLGLDTITYLSNRVKGGPSMADTILEKQDGAEEIAG